MTTAFVLGNGISRQTIDLNQLKTCGKIYGCNALYREFVPDVLVATDKPIAATIQESGYSAKNVFYTRRPLHNLGAKPVPKDYFGYSSGPIAVSLAALDQHRRVYLLGFDMGPDSNRRFNNIYAGTEYYKPKDSNPTFTGNWIKQLQKICEDFSSTRFIRIYGPTTAKIAELDAIKNMEHRDLIWFQQRLNSEKDL